ncbi:hypothetical protein TraAM80_10382 [Trypanosoma rangeli]|uniref:Secreted protein n=1 Tax=Trypanosoma rangeli TaxID=5698 RepID=A0A3R7LWV2_TRYRA|nr:uncharacterized protein TraAM80_10382 [Trypanosoma rangeli]RNE95135.1 hypothetical protein TraAM80_10382 [Trypanosoma rangeli]|eukprot:RNE95135.1 hypothetical protein TraAM80_10382 [Trypanosoma rangeli]
MVTATVRRRAVCALTLLRLRGTVGASPASTLVEVRGSVMTKSWVDVFVARGNGQIMQNGLNLLTFPRRLRATVVTASASLSNRRTWAAVVDRAAGGPVPRGHAAFTAPFAMQGSALRRKWQGV